VFNTRSLGCKACSLGEKTELRALSVGEPTADIMLVGCDLRSTHPFSPGIGGHAARYGAASGIIPAGGPFIDRWCESRDVAPERLFSTYAVRCLVHAIDERQPDPIHKLEGVLPCLQHHLSFEIERMQPQVIVCFGPIAKAAIMLYWSFPARYTVKVRSGGHDALRVLPPECWWHDATYIFDAPPVSSRKLLDESRVFDLLDEAMHHVRPRPDR